MATTNSIQEPPQLLLQQRIINVKRWFMQKGISQYAVFVKAFYPEFQDYVKLKNVWALRSVDDDITDMLEQVIVKLDKEL